MGWVSAHSVTRGTVATECVPRPRGTCRRFMSPSCSGVVAKAPRANRVPYGSCEGFLTDGAATDTVLILPHMQSRVLSMRWWLALAFASIAALTAVVVAQVFNARSEDAIRVRARELAAGSAVIAAHAIMG